MTSQANKFEVFRDLHRRPGAFVLPNPWDAGSARILTALGFEALATTSAGFAFSIGRQDSAAALSRKAVLQNAREIVEATNLPVSADLEDGFGADPGSCSQTISMASAAGLVGGSIEDATGNPADPIYAFGLAVERVAAAAEEARKHPFLLTARTENFLHGKTDLDDTIRRLQAFEKAGADVLYAPGLPNLETIRVVCSSVNRPVNVVMGLGEQIFTVDELAEAGVKRISVGGSFARAALAGLMRAAREVKDYGTFTYAKDAIPAGEVKSYMLKADR
ncbi:MULTISPECIES: isocitrate lyase/phosphoenolpyruvate mutase family protein [unclassified Chelatococcus]|uniref:isocitrate lyase/PEP mutase family protein n=1 Tax=unclassified Chelatococcus TaxID=2638111 RepID=UPI001BCBC02D|nr:MULTISPECIES: isocitrate lyase/phosphoenolpyruvate mutase family protein [unclassified Chelatococcus]MBS7700717.1 isocitrate lyase/phosphoenolpyruvate mutase family protein [Chelatococcus sp. YT9]MBX3559301.1 isocitrate lyase/phosphoenolpyruvate mutase family protein [Chelatococcus sp.]